MTAMPTLGGLDEKYAGAYLIRPTAKPKKKKKKKSKRPTLKGLDKAAADAAVQAISAQQIAMRQRLQSGDLGGGWNPFDQLTDNNS
jgi:hypothetical protein